MTTVKWHHEQVLHCNNILEWTTCNCGRSFNSLERLNNHINSLKDKEETTEFSEPDKQGDDICGLCGQPGADKFKHPIHWPGEVDPDGDLVHVECEQEECRRAHSLLSDRQREIFLRSI